MDTADAEGTGRLRDAGSDDARRPDTAVELLMLDLGGVLIAGASPVLLAELARAPGASADALRAEFERIKPDFWSGRMTIPEAWRRLAAVAGVPHAPCPWAEDRPPTGLVPLPALARVPTWARTVRVGVLSNEHAEWVLPILASSGVLDVLDPLLISSRTGVVKPDPAAFAQVAAGGVPAARTLFVDDQAVNLAAAAACGIRTLWADPDGAWTAEVDRLLAVPATR